MNDTSGRHVRPAPAIPSRAQALIWTVALGGVLAIAFQVPQVRGWTIDDMVAFLVLSVAGAVLEQLPVPLRYGSEQMSFSMTDALWMAALLTARPSVLSLAMGAGLLGAQIVHRRPLYKLAFNFGQLLVAITAAEVVFQAQGAVPPTAPRAWLAATMGMAAYFLVNSSAVTLVIALVSRKRFLSVVTEPLVLNLANWTGNMAIGLLLAVVWTTQPFALPLVLVPLAIAYFAYRAWQSGLQERHRISSLYDASLSLTAPLDRSDFEPFLTVAEDLLDARRVELVLTTEGATGKEEGEQVRSSLRGERAPIGPPGSGRGFLVVHRDAPFSDSERSMLATLAGHVYVRLENLRLFREELEQRSQLDQIISHTSDGIFVVSSEGEILTWNPGMERITGFSSDEAVGQTVRERLRTDVHSGVLGPGGTDSPGGALSGDLPVIRNDGAERWLRWSANPIPAAQGRVSGHVVLARDVTVELETERLKTDFVATVSHELRSPLTPLKGFLVSLLEGTIEDSADARQEYYEIMLSQAERLERLVSDLLDVSRIESGTSRIETRTIDLGSLLQDQVKAFARRDPGRPIRLAHDDRPVRVEADRFRVEQILDNLVSNALKYSPQGTSVEIGMVVRGDHAIVSVADHGEGIPSSELDRVFDRFHRVDNGLTRQRGGAGLGLYITRQLVQAMSGHVWVTSKEGHGSTFSFTLPLAVTAPGGATHELQAPGLPLVAPSVVSSFAWEPDDRMPLAVSVRDPH